MKMRCWSAAWLYEFTSRWAHSALGILSVTDRSWVCIRGHSDGPQTIKCRFSRKRQKQCLFNFSNLLRDWGCSGTECWGEYVERREMKWGETGENCLMRSFNNLYTSPSIIRMIKSRRIRWAGYIARMRRRGMHIGFWWESKDRYLRKTKTKVGGQC
jgi:hypothetical protein